MVRRSSFSARTHADAPAWCARDVEIVLPARIARSILQTVRGLRANGDGRYTIRSRATIVVWREGAPVGSFTLAQNRPRAGRATLRRLEWDAAGGRSEEEIWDAMADLAGEPIPSGGEPPAREEDPAPASHEELGDLPARWAYPLARAGFHTRAAIAAASDEDLLALPYVSADGLARVRASIPRGLPTPPGPPFAWARAAAKRHDRAAARSWRDHLVRETIVHMLAAGEAVAGSRLRQRAALLAGCREAEVRLALAQLVRDGTLACLEPSEPSSRERLYQLPRPDV